MKPRLFLVSIMMILCAVGVSAAPEFSLLVDGPGKYAPGDVISVLVQLNPNGEEVTGADFKLNINGNALYTKVQDGDSFKFNPGELGPFFDNPFFNKDSEEQEINTVSDDGTVWTFSAAGNPSSNFEILGMVDVEVGEGGTFSLELTDTQVWTDGTDKVTKVTPPQKLENTITRRTQEETDETPELFSARLGTLNSKIEAILTPNKCHQGLYCNIQGKDEQMKAIARAMSEFLNPPPENLEFRLG